MRLRQGDVVVDRFEVRRQAGAGGMSLVYVALDRTTGEQVAFKVLDGDRASTSRFVRETRVLSELHHPAVVSYIAHGSLKDGTPWLAMEWLEGEDLSQRLARSPLTVVETLALATNVAEALGAAHQRGVVHRDVKPSNLFLPGGAIDRVKVLDFGIARVTMGDLTATNSRVGTPAYMSPEQARGMPPPGPGSDVFSLGVVLHQCLTGRRPFIGDDAMAVIARILLADPPRVREQRPDVPAELDQLVWQMLSKKPEDRPADGDAVAARLREIASSTAADATGPTSLGAGEHRLTCLVLARNVGPHRIPAVEQAAAGFGGRVETAADGSVAILLSGAGVATDLTAQGARLALAIREIAPDAPIALVTGRAVTSERTPVGEVIDRAVALLRGPPTRDDSERSTARDRPQVALESVAETLSSVLVSLDVPTTAPFLRPPGDDSPAPILVDEITAGLLDARFEVGGAGRHLALRAEREAGELPRTLLGKPTAFIARDAELAALEASFAAAVDEPGPRVVLLTAPPGVGKSRLRQELIRRIIGRGQPVEVLIGRGDPLTAGAPFGPLADAVRRAAGFHDGEALAVRRSKLRARAGRHVDAASAQRVAEFLGEMIGLPFPLTAAGPGDASPQGEALGHLPGGGGAAVPRRESLRVELRAARGDARLMGDQIRRAWEEWLAAECRAQPVVLALEDLHWGDQPTIECVDAALRNLADLPLLVVATARPEIREAFPDLWSDRGLVELRLPELSRRAAERLVLAALGTRTPPEVVARVVERAAGNALYLEELIRAAAEGKDETSPSTLIAMVQARLERMEPDARRILRAAAVFGETFAPDGVAHLLGDAADVTPWLGALVDREVIATRGARVTGEVVYVFRHALVRDAAYAMLTPDDRTLGHRLAAAWLETAGERDPVRLAEHHERGAAAERALSWWLRAAEQALGACDLAAVLAHVQRAIACGAAGTTLGELRLLAAEAHDWRGEHADAARAARDALRWLQVGSAPWFAAAGVLATAAGVQGLGRDLLLVADDVNAALDLLLEVDTPPADTLALTSARLAEQLIITGHHDRADALLARLAQFPAPGPAAAGRVHAVQALRARYAGDVAGNLTAVEAAVECFAAAGDRRNLCVHNERLGYARLEIGDHPGSELELKGALAAAQVLGLRTVAATARHNLGLSLSRLGRHGEALDVEREALAEFTATGNRRMRGASLEYLALIHLGAGDALTAEASAREAVDVASLAPALPLNQAESWAILGRALLAQGRAFDALEVAEHGLAMLERLGGIDDGESIIRLTHAEALAAVGDTAAAIAAITRARTRLLERADRIRDARLRASFLERVPENRATLMSEICPPPPAAVRFAAKEEA